jgi:hypothetical protein
MKCCEHDPLQIRSYLFYLSELSGPLASILTKVWLGSSMKQEIQPANRLSTSQCFKIYRTRYQTFFLRHRHSVASTIKNYKNTLTIVSDDRK